MESQTSRERMQGRGGLNSSPWCSSYQRARGSSAGRPSLHLEARGVKREMTEAFPYVVVGQPGWGVDDYKERHRISPEVEAGGWLRDEPVDGQSGMGSVIQRSGSTSTFSRDSSAGPGNQGNLGVLPLEGGSIFAPTKNSAFTNGPSISRSSAPDSLPSGSPGRLPDLTEDAAGRSKQSSSPSVAQAEQRANLFAQLRRIRIKESVICSAIERLGGGQKGLRELVKHIMVWLRMKQQASPPHIGEQLNAQELLAPISPEEIEKAYNQVPLFENSFGTSQSAQNGAARSVSTDVHTLIMNSAYLEGGAGAGDGEYGEGRNYEKQLLALNEQGALGGMLDVLGMQELGVQGSGAIVDVSPPTVGCWSGSFITDERQHRVGIRRLSPSPERVSLPSDLGYDDPQTHRNKMRHLSPPANSSSSSCDVPPYSNVSQAMPDVIFSPSPFHTFSMSPSSPSLDPHALDMGSFSSFNMQGTSLIDDASLGGTAGIYSVDCTVDQSGTRLGLLGKSKPTPAAHTRLARKNRMDRNRRSASLHTTRSTQSGVPSGGATGAVWSPSASGAIRRTPPSQSVPGGDGEQTTGKEKRDMDHVQYLLQKALKPSDVGNLGRIVLPKKDAESHLPWLAAREGIAFPCEDFDTGEKMNLRYRFWPNNKSRMYLLENTGEFVKKHKLEEGDRLMIYKNIQDNTFIIRGRKAQDCVDLPSNQIQADDSDGRGKEIPSQGSPVSASSSGISSNDLEVAAEAPLERAISGHEGSSTSSVTAGAIITSQDDLLNFADLPDAPMGDGTEPLVRFPSLEAFDELLEMVPAALSQQQQEHI